MCVRLVMFAFIVVLGLSGCAKGTRQGLIQQLPTTVPSNQTSEIVSAKDKTQNLSPQEFYGLYVGPSSCVVTPLVGNEIRRTFPAWWLDGDGMVAGTPIGVLFEGGNKVQWQLEQPGTLLISGKRLDGQSPPLAAENIVSIGLANYSSAIIFPAPGCWSLHAEAGAQSLDAIVYVYPSNCLPPGMRGRQIESPEIPCKSPS